MKCGSGCHVNSPLLFPSPTLGRWDPFYRARGAHTHIQQENKTNLAESRHAVTPPRGKLMQPLASVSKSISGCFHERNGIKGIRFGNRGCCSQDDGWAMSTITWMPRAYTQPFLWSRLWLSLPITRKIKMNSAEPLMGLDLSLL